MAGTVLSIGIVLCAATLTSGFAIVAGGGVVGQRAAGAADAAALAAADAASGAIAGVPCERAAQISAAVGAELVGCEVDDLVATVTVAVPFGALSARASARAGPPG